MFHNKVAPAPGHSTKIERPRAYCCWKTVDEINIRVICIRAVKVDLSFNSILLPHYHFCAKFQFYQFFTYGDENFRVAIRIRSNFRWFALIRGCEVVSWVSTESQSKLSDSQNSIAVSKCRMLSGRHWHQFVRLRLRDQLRRMME